MSGTQTSADEDVESRIVLRVFARPYARPGEVALGNLVQQTKKQGHEED